MEPVSNLSNNSESIDSNGTLINHAPQPNWTNLPPEILQNIFSNLQSKCLRDLREVCKLFRDVIQSDVQLTAKALSFIVMKKIFQVLSKDHPKECSQKLVQAAAGLFVYKNGKKAVKFLEGNNKIFQSYVAYELVEKCPRLALDLAKSLERSFLGRDVNTLLLLESSEFEVLLLEVLHMVFSRLIELHYQNREIMKGMLETQFSSTHAFGKYEEIRRLLLKESPHEELRNQFDELFAQGSPLLKCPIFHEFIGKADLLRKYGKVEEARSLFRHLEKSLQSVLGTPRLFILFFELLFDTDQVLAQSFFMKWMDRLSDEGTLRHLFIFFGYRFLDSDRAFSFLCVDRFLSLPPPEREFLDACKLTSLFQVKLIACDFEKGVKLFEHLYTKNRKQPLISTVVGVSQIDQAAAKRLYTRYPRYTFLALCTLADRCKDKNQRKEYLKEIEDYLEKNRDNLTGDALHKQRAAGYSFFDPEKAKLEASLIHDQTVLEKTKISIDLSYFMNGDLKEGFAYFDEIHLGNPKKNDHEKCLIPLIIDQDMVALLSRAKENKEVRPYYLIALSKRILSLLEKKS